MSALDPNVGPLPGALSRGSAVRPVSTAPTRSCPVGVRHAVREPYETSRHTRRNDAPGRPVHIAFETHIHAVVERGEAGADYEYRARRLHDVVAEMDALWIVRFDAAIADVDAARRGGCRRRHVDRVVVDLRAGDPS